jgi:two-component system, NtrC family, nitrogen regulation sensor histidine kinase NtrY
MVYKSFRVNVIVRIVLLIAVILLLLHAFLNTSWVVTTALLLGVLTYQVAEMISYVDRVNREFSRFLQAIRHRDFSQVFASDGRGKSFNELRDSFNLIIREFQAVSAEREAHYVYLQTVIEHVGVGLVSFDANGDVELMNKAAKEMFSLPYARNIKAFARVSEPLAQVLETIRPGKRELLKLHVQGELWQLAIHATQLKVKEKEYKLVSLQNIRGELDEKELDTWQKLIRVLTHEIMNSVTPISSLTSTTIALIENEEGNLKEDVLRESMHDIHIALRTIEKRSQGLLHFVEVYRNLARIPKPALQKVNVFELLERIEKLMETNIEEKGIEFTVLVKSSPLYIHADPELVEQVLINLLLNAMDAVEGIPHPSVELIAYQEQGQSCIQVSDNGPGIPEEVLDKIFIPFFTTKKKGSGIGLSLSRQIMRMHSGNISVLSVPGKTVFVLKF